MSKDITLTLIIVVVAILLLQSIFLFLDARKRNYNYWLWGIIGLIQAPMPALFYLIFVRKVFQKKL
ncbi:sigma-Y antisigma factor component [Neobacillus ginsengisoli]|uniref:PurR-regulated permease PerM n=1 Tax=Neobacillus ginsengisoli TaxID=904295 RepID=A0ABT9XRB8_9BACI|nr:sigma-Y antisigma factor component [Neobacillus ginsengisoli]MDQ0198083.1 putative PurR-regulated permease PerM [Neobacillus ginsengisoli]